MVSEDLDFSVSVVEFADGTKVKVDTGDDDDEMREKKEDNPDISEFVSPADRFTEDYDRSYPPQLRSVRGDQNRPPADEHSRYGERGSGNYYKPHRYEKWRENAEDGRENGMLPQRYGQSYDRRTSSERSDVRRNHNSDFSSDRRPSNASSERNAWGKPSGGDHVRRDSSNNGEVERGWGRGRGRHEPRANQEGKGGFHPTLLQRSRRMSEQSAVSENSRDDNRYLHAVDSQDIVNDKSSTGDPNALKIVHESNEDRPPEVAAAQREVMLTAAERAKKRRDEEEAEYEAARERARQKALTLAKQSEDSSTKEKTGESGKKQHSTNTKSPPTINATHTEANPDQTTESSANTAWSEFMDQKKAGSAPEVHTDSTDWNSYAKQLSEEIKAEVGNAVEKPADKQSDKSDDLKADTKNSSVDEEKSETKDEKPDEQKSGAEKDEKPDEQKSGVKKDETDVTKAEKDVNTSATDVPVKKPTFPLTEDDQNWEQYVTKLKKPSNSPVAVNTTVNAWNSYATRLQKLTSDRRQTLLKSAGQEDAVVEVHDYQREARLHSVREQSQARGGRGPRNNREEHPGRTARGPGRDNAEKPQATGRDAESRPSKGGNSRAEMAVSWRRRSEKSSTTPSEKSENIVQDAKEEAKTVLSDLISVEQSMADEPVFAPTENLSERTHEKGSTAKKQLTKEAVVRRGSLPVEKKQNDVPKLSTARPVDTILRRGTKQKKKRSILQESTSPIFPEAVERIARKKPASMSFMVDSEESDLEITMVNRPAAANNEDISKEIPNETKDSRNYTSIQPIEVPHLFSAEHALPPQEKYAPNGSPADQSSSPQAAIRQHPLPDQRLVSGNPNFPLLVYQFPMGDGSPLPNAVPFGVRPEQRGGFVPGKGQRPPGGIYIVPPQQFQAGNQYMVAFPQAGAGNMQPQPMYPPNFRWQPPPMPNYMMCPHPDHRPRRPSANARSPRPQKVDSQEPHTDAGASSPAAESEPPVHSTDSLPWGQSANHSGRNTPNYRGRGGSRGRGQWNGRGGRGYSGGRHIEHGQKEAV
ncbi:hypothetical protein DFQ29_000463 [Apophysomyces sp. BC1021]|nr:hypothetical protein DFQ29_000463 [Apophysomyces sp. BC1021]